MQILSLVKVPLGKPREFFLCLLSSPPASPSSTPVFQKGCCPHFPSVLVAVHARSQGSLGWSTVRR